MVSKIGSSSLASLLGAGSNTGLVGSARISGSDPLRAQLNSSDGEATQIALSKTTSASKTASYQGVKEFLQVRENATSNITELRAEQKALADKGKTLAESEELSNLQDRYDEINTEISRIQSAATYNGQNVLQGGTFGENNSSDGVESRVVSASNLSALTRDPGLSLATPADAEAASESLSVLNGLTSTASIDSASALSAASAPVGSGAAELPESGKTLSVEDSRKTASSVLGKYTSSSGAGYAAEESTKALIDSIGSSSAETKASTAA